MLKLTFWLMTVSAGLIAGCASEPTEVDLSADLKNTPLYDAPERTQTTCTSTQALSVQHPMHTIIFDCPQLHAQATSEQIKDAGWAIESIDIGHQVSAEGSVEMPLKIIIRKLN